MSNRSNTGFGPASGVRSQKRSPGAPITKPRSGVCVDLHLSSVQWSHPWCGNPYGLAAYAVGTLHWSSFYPRGYELLENSLGEGKLHDPASPSGTKTAN